MTSNTGTQRLFAWTGLAMLVLFLVGFWPIAGYVPPSSPKDGVDEILAFYTGDTDLIRLGLWLTMLAAAFCVTFVKSGPVAWNGVIAWWLLLAGFGVWVLVLVYGLLRHAIPSHERELAAATS